MNGNPEQNEQLTDALAEGIAAVIAADAALGEAEDLADLFLEELNRLWSEPEDPEAA